MPDVLDYSSGYPSPAAIRAAGYVGVVRYIGTPGRSKNLTRAEAVALRAAGIPAAFVYEDTAGWMLGGHQAGVNAAVAARADLANLGQPYRCIHFADDQDTVTAAQFAAVNACLDGAASVIGLPATGVYGEADVIDAALGGGHAAWGWQTRAWSGGRVSSRAHLLQQIGYVNPGGIQCDRSTVLKSDWGQWPLEGIDDMTDAQYEALDTKLDNMYRIMVFGDAPDSQLGPDGKPVDKGGHGNNLEAIRNDVRAMRAALGAQLTAQASAIGALSGLIGAGTNDLTAEAVKAAVAAAIQENLVHVQVSVDSAPGPGA